MNQRIAFRPQAFLMAVIIACCGCGRPQGDISERDAIAFIRKVGGKVEFEGTGDDQRVIKAYLHSTSVKDGDLAALRQFSKLRNLFLGKTQIGDAGLEHLQGFTELQTLSLTSTRVTDAGLEHLSKLTNLKTLNLQETQVTAAGAARLRKALPGATIAR